MPALALTGVRHWPAIGIAGETSFCYDVSGIRGAINRVVHAAAGAARRAERSIGTKAHKAGPCNPKGPLLASVTWFTQRRSTREYCSAPHLGAARGGSLAQRLRSCRSRRIAAARSSSVTTCRGSHQKVSPSWFIAAQARWQGLDISALLFERDRRSSVQHVSLCGRC